MPLPQDPTYSAGLPGGPDPAAVGGQLMDAQKAGADAFHAVTADAGGVFGTNYDANGNPIQDSSPLQNTSSLRNDANSNKKTATDILGHPLLNDANYVPFGDTQGAADAQARVNEAGDRASNANNGVYTDTENDRITAAQENAKAAYMPLVQAAIDAKNQGMPKDVVAAGEQGGFMNTQYAGAAALLPVNSGDFIGAGGALEQVKSAYDTNIATATMQMNNAITQARTAAQQAIVTGDKQDLKDAQDAFDRAQSAYNDRLTLAQKRDTDFAAAQDRQLLLIRNAKADAASTVDSLATAGITLTPDEVKQFADAYGMTTDTFQKLYDVTKEQKSGANNATALDQAQKLASILSTLPAGTPIKIGDNTYYGTSGTGSLQVDDNGEGTMAVVDQTTGKISIKDIGFVGAPKDGWTAVTGKDGSAWSVNTRTGKWIPAMEPGTNGSDHISADWTSILPNGATYTGNGRDPSGQCGVLVNDMTGLGVGDTLQSKTDKIDKTLGTVSNPLQVGDVVVMNAGTHGHVAVINRIALAPDGSTALTLTEQNWKQNAQGQGIIDNTRTISANDPTVLGFARGKLAPNFAAGPSTSSQQINLNGTNAPADPKLVSDFAQRYATASTEADRKSVMDQAKGAGVDEKTLMDAAAVIQKPKGQFVDVQSGLQVNLDPTDAKYFNVAALVANDLAPRVSDLLSSAVAQDATGAVQGTAIDNLPAGLRTNVQDAIKSLTSQLQLNAASLYSRGGTVSPEVYKAIQDFAPDTKATVAQNLSRIHELRTTLLDAAAREMSSKGITNNEKILVTQKSDKAKTPGLLPINEFSSSKYDIVD